LPAAEVERTVSEIAYLSVAAIDDDAKAGTYGGAQSSIGMGRSHAARQLLEWSGQPR
jgi:hypothetical protein